MRSAVASWPCAAQRSPASSRWRRSPWPRQRREAGELPLRRPGPAELALAGDAPRQPQQRPQPDPRPLPRRSALALSHRRGIFSTPVIGGDGTVYVGSADHYFYALRPDGRLRWKLRTGGIIDAAAAIGPRRRRQHGVPDHDRLRRRAPLPPARRPPPAAAQRRVLWRFRTDARRPPASWSTGGRATSRSARRRRSTPATPAAAPTRSRPAAPSAGSTRAPTRSGPPRPSTPRGTTYWGSVDLHAFALDPLRAAALEPPSPATSPPRRRSAATAPSTSAPSTPAPRARPRDRRRALELHHRRAHLRLPGAREGLRGPDHGDLHRLRRRLALRAAPRRQPDLAL